MFQGGITWLEQYTLLKIINLIAIYPFDSITRPLNNSAQAWKLQF